MMFSRTPALFVFLLALSAPLQASAQPTPAPVAKESQEALEKARQLFSEGLKEYLQKQYAKAYVSFTASWALKQHYTTAANLGDCEAHLGKYRDAAEHLAYAIRSAPVAEAAERKKLQAQLEQMRAHIGTVAITVDGDGAEVLVDEITIGKAPLADPVFVNPGPHRVRARDRQSSSKEEVVEATPGSTHTIALRIEAVPAGPPAPKLDERVGAPGTHSTPTTTAESTGPNPIVLIAGTALSLAGIGVGIGLAAASGGNGTEADERAEELRQTGGTNPCQSLPSACADIQSDLEARDALGNGAIVSFALAGAVGIATVTYALVSRRPPAAAGGIRMLPAVGAHQGGIVLLGSW